MGSQQANEFKHTVNSQQVVESCKTSTPATSGLSSLSDNRDVTLALTAVLSYKDSIYKSLYGLQRFCLKT